VGCLCVWGGRDGGQGLDVPPSPTGRRVLLFNDADALAFTAIAERAGVEDAELRRTLQSLALGQVRGLCDGGQVLARDGPALSRATPPQLLYFCPPPQVRVLRKEPRARTSSTGRLPLQR